MTGSAEFIDHGPEVLQAIDDNIDDGLSDFANTWAEVATELSPHKTGNNARSIRAKPLGPRLFEVRTSSGYGAWLELGTARMPARPYFAPAAREAAREAARKWRKL